ncbi:UNVERIFIED_CONTAM: Haloacid dehalogenase-like hydrolase domain-containing protein 3 [Siphonaria sp. JEL0065]|nr:Haloacid dehalogenase-like hydrolase domain-containing protein 3 [Siphonaria sp. JEL0065]
MRNKVITFDAFNTLFRLKDSVANIYIQQLRLHCGPSQAPTPAAVALSFQSAFKRNDRLHPLFGRDLKGGYPTWWQTVVNQTFEDAGVDKRDLNQKDISQHIFNHFSTAAPFEVNPAARPLLAELKGRQFVVGIVSNSDERTLKVLDEFGLTSFIDFAVLSSSAGFEKPNPHMFQIALDRASELAGVQIYTHNALHIGDDLTRDFEAAKACGWNARLLTKDWEALQNLVQEAI